MSEERKCAHCNGTGSTTKSCCNRKELGKSSNWGANADVRCCACGGSGCTSTPSTFIP